MRRRLTNEEREIRGGRGIPFGRWWPILMFLVAMIIISSSNLDLFERCLGDPLDGQGKGWAAARMLATIPCSVFLLRGGALEWLLFAGLWGAVPIAILNYRWVKRHELYWDKVRLREAQRRAEKRSQRNVVDAASSPPAPHGGGGAACQEEAPKS
jgi:hypothetical protein